MEYLFSLCSWNHGTYLDTIFFTKLIRLVDSSERKPFILMKMFSVYGFNFFTLLQTYFQIIVIRYESKFSSVRRVIWGHTWKCSDLNTDSVLIHSQ